jgi:hypothetical protein
VSGVREAQGTVSIRLVHRGLVAIVVAGIVATAFELASERHWTGLVQLVPWAALVVLVIAVLLLSGRGTVAPRVLALVVLGASAYGVLEHVLVNYGSGALDQRFADTWDTLPVLQRLWYAVTKTVGPAPTLAPGVLAQTALLLLLATFCGPHRSRVVEPRR